MLMLDSVASPDWMNTRVLVMGSSSLADAAVDDVVVVSWAEIMSRSRKATRMNCSTLMIIFDKNIFEIFCTWVIDRSTLIHQQQLFTLYHM